MAPQKKELMLVTEEDLRVTLDVAGKPVNSLVDMGAIYSVLTAHSRPISSSKICLFIKIKTAPRLGLILLSLFLTHGLYLRKNIK